MDHARKASVTPCPNLVTESQKYEEETKLTKADHMVVVNCNIVSNISSGTALILQGMFTFEKRFYKSLLIVLQQKVDR